MDPRLIDTKRLTVTVAAVLSPTQIIVHVNSMGDLLLTAHEPMREHLKPGAMIGLEVSLGLYEQSGRKNISLSLVPPGGYKWVIPLKSVHPCMGYSV
jgi:hypothetical protein